MSDNVFYSDYVAREWLFWQLKDAQPQLDAYWRNDNHLMDLTLTGLVSRIRIDGETRYRIADELVADVIARRRAGVVAEYRASWVGTDIDTGVDPSDGSRTRARIVATNAVGIVEVSYVSGHRYAPVPVRATWGDDKRPYTPVRAH